MEYVTMGLACTSPVTRAVTSRGHFFLWPELEGSWNSGLPTELSLPIPTKMLRADQLITLSTAGSPQTTKAGGSLPFSSPTPRFNLTSPFLCTYEQIPRVGSEIICLPEKRFSLHTCQKQPNRR